MDDSLALSAIIAFLALNLAMMFVLWTEMRWHSRQRDELTRLLIMALFRMSKDQVKALEEQTRRGDARGILLLRALRDGRKSAGVLVEAQQAGEEEAYAPREDESTVRAEPPRGEIDRS